MTGAEQTLLFMGARGRHVLVWEAHWHALHSNLRGSVGMFPHKILKYKLSEIESGSDLAVYQNTILILA